MKAIIKIAIAKCTIKIIYKKYYYPMLNKYKKISHSHLLKIVFHFSKDIRTQIHKIKKK